MIDFGHDYKPVIKITKENSEDVRDRLLNAFFEELGYETSCLFIANQTPFDSSINTYTIATMPYDKRFRQFGEEMLNAVGDDGQARAKIQEFFQWFGHRIGYESYPIPVEDINPPLE